MEDPTGMLVRVSAFNSLSDHMNHIFEVFFKFKAVSILKVTLLNFNYLEK